MIVVESGGTKSTWVFVSENEKKFIETVGLHPQELSAEKEKAISSLIESENLNGQSIYFFGAGCESLEAKSKITIFLEQLELDVKQVHTDIYAACLAHLGNNSGIVGIMGTGAVAAQFDGAVVVKQTSGLGYILGDEGSGFDLGKRLLQYHFNKDLPIEIVESIESYFDHKSILHRIQESDGRMCIAGLTRIVHQFRDFTTVKSILNSSFSAFCKTALEPLDKGYSINFIGSVAFFFQDELKQILNENGYLMGEVKKEAVNSVFNFLNS
ncbi:hypothetical protein [Brumimicrobium mesophilum]|uniref:hypothetical protein n=1 Tax=Brumimicrobium mesophilum TaxID=392717 RepID=UPI000D1443C4|nr:hypothetical protein [Brumimicrobium mesophilum]